MSNRTLAQLAAAQIPSVQLDYMYPHEKFVLNFEILPYIKRFGRRSERALQTPEKLKSMCGCNDNGDCLCYLAYIRDLSINEWWGDPADFETLGGWLIF